MGSWAAAATVIASQAVISARSQCPAGAPRIVTLRGFAHRPHLLGAGRADLRPVDSTGPVRGGARAFVFTSPHLDRAGLRGTAVAVTSRSTITTLCFFYIVRHPVESGRLLLVLLVGGILLTVRPVSSPPTSQAAAWRLCRSPSHRGFTVPHHLA